MNEMRALIEAAKEMWVKHEPYSRNTTWWPAIAAAERALNVKRPTPAEGEPLTADERTRLGELCDKATRPPWVWHTSNSWKRLKRDDLGIIQNVAEPYICKDRCPDLTINEADMDFIAASRTALPRALRQLALLEVALIELLLSADASWEEQNLGHDWRRACDRARKALGL